MLDWGETGGQITRHSLSEVYGWIKPQGACMALQGCKLNALIAVALQ